MYNNNFLKNIFSTFDLIHNSEIRSKFLTSMQRDYEKLKGRNTTQEERDVIWKNTKGFQDIIDVLKVTHIQNIRETLNKANKTIKDLNLCN